MQSSRRLQTHSLQTRKEILRHCRCMFQDIPVSQYKCECCHRTLRGKAKQDGIDAAIRRGAADPIILTVDWGPWVDWVDWVDWDILNHPRPPKPACTPSPRTSCYYCGTPGVSVCVECAIKARTEPEDEPDHTGEDKAFYRRHRVDAKHKRGVAKTERDNNIHGFTLDKNQRADAQDIQDRLERETSRRTAISKRNVYASPEPESKWAENADRKYDVVAKAKERRERRPSEQVVLFELTPTAR